MIKRTPMPRRFTEQMSHILQAGSENRTPAHDEAAIINRAKAEAAARDLAAAAKDAIRVSFYKNTTAMRRLQDKLAKFEEAISP